MKPVEGSVLVVDDNPAFLDVVQDLLGEGGLGLQVDVATTGVGALAHLEATPSRRAPAFVVLDFHLPDIDAPEMLRRLRRRPALHATPVLVLTQVDWEADRVAALAAGAQAFAVKPSRVSALRALLVEQLRHVFELDPPSP